MKLKGWYKLDKDKNVIPIEVIEDIHLDRKDVIVKQDSLSETIMVSTVFLGLDHRMDGIEGPPVVFETMVFGGDFDQEQERYCTYEEAKKGHERWVADVKKVEGL